MPFVNVHIGKSVTAEEKLALAGMIASNMPLIPGKTKDNTMIEISAGRDMFMGGEQRALIFVDMRLYTPAPVEAKEKFIATLAAEFEKMLDIPANQQYYNMMELDSWGAQGKLLHG